jgi:hypothetical protein
MRNAKEKCRQLEENHRKMKRKVNPKVLSMIDRCVCSLEGYPAAMLTFLSNSVEKKEKDLIGMYKQVVKDKTKIEETVAVLDEHKTETLKKTWEIVNTFVLFHLPLSHPPAHLFLPLPANSATFSPNFSRATSASCKRSKARRSLKVSKSRSDSVPSGRLP